LCSHADTQTCAVLGSSDCSHYSLLRWLPPSGTRVGSSRGSVSGPPAGSRPAAATPFPAGEGLSHLLDDGEAYAAVRQAGFVRGLLLPLRNTLGNAARLGALLEDGPGPYNKQEVGVHRSESAIRTLDLAVSEGLA
jgi:hypothetical protein